MDVSPRGSPLCFSFLEYPDVVRHEELNQHRWFLPMVDRRMLVRHLHFIGVLGFKWPLIAGRS